MRGRRRAIGSKCSLLKVHRAFHLRIILISTHSNIPHAVDVEVFIFAEGANEIGDLPDEASASPASEVAGKELAIRTSQVNAAQRPKTDSTKESKEEATQQGEQERSNQSSFEPSEEEGEQVSGEESKEESSEDKGESGEKDGAEGDSGEKPDEESGDEGEGDSRSSGDDEESGDEGE
ncbi:hypothetical protein Syun_023464 [Stephania yunnanensis]|uniref:Uncharacterized protein n=1 Tax=Stephania yunnanensis TaxID=152371 RepID=A0AAP0FMY8_9MAGN